MERDIRRRSVKRFLRLGLICILLFWGASHELPGAKPPVPSLKIEGKVNIATYDSTDYIRVWEKAATGDSFQESWKSVRVHTYETLAFSDPTNGAYGATALIGTQTIVVGIAYQVRFAVFTEGSAGTPRFVSEYINGEHNGYRFVSSARVADVTPALTGNEVVLNTDNTLALFWFDGSSFLKKAEVAFPGEEGKFYELWTGNVDEDAEEEIIVSVRNAGQVWIYNVVDQSGSLSFAEPVMLDPGECAWGSLMGDRIRVADVDGDGLLDIVAYSTRTSDGTICKYFNTWINAGGGYQPFSQAIGLPDSLIRFDAANLDSDPGAEVVIGGRWNPPIEVWEWQGGSWAPAFSLPLDRGKAEISVSHLGGTAPRIIVAGSNPDVFAKQFYMEIYEYAAGSLSSLWKYEGKYYAVTTLGND